MAGRFIIEKSPKISGCVQLYVMTRIRHPEEGKQTALSDFVYTEDKTPEKLFVSAVITCVTDGI